MNSVNKTFQRRGNVLSLSNKPVCPECHAPMNEVERVQEGGFDYVWYECDRSNCDGRWLEKKRSLRLDSAEPSMV